MYIIQGTTSGPSWNLVPSQAARFIPVYGQTDLTYGVGGVGNLDISQANIGNPAISQGERNCVSRTKVIVPPQGDYINIRPYYKIDYQLATFNSTSGNFDSSSAPFDSFLSTRTITDFWRFTVTFPPNVSDTAGEPALYNDDHSLNRISIPDTNVMYSTSGEGGLIGIGTYVRFGIEVDMSFQVVQRSRKLEKVIVDVSFPLLSGRRCMLCHKLMKVGF